ncbi:MAG: PilT/PilU family type 4a pilus ATPase [Candidatus Aureabacteria bacterium]|nr:PilT/PilU family type 4a pilus ATPase [Candidatus Auribacterota bacterium]
MINIKELLKEAVKKGASDVHIKVKRPPIMRINRQIVITGYDVLKPEDTMSIARSITTEGQWKKLMDEHEIDFAYSESEVGRFRTNIFYQRGSIGIVMRHVRTDILSFEQLGLPGVLEQISLFQRGIILVCGASSSGKSTTLAAMVNYINSHERRHIVTLEDPIEYLHADRECVINQREVGLDTKSFYTALKNVLRQDPDVILIGEMRDADSFTAAVGASDTGHLVLSTLHTANASQAFGRIMDLFPSSERDQVRQQLAFNLKAVICQRLIKTPDGSGVVPAVEILLNNKTVQKLVIQNKLNKIPDAIEIGRDDGMQTFNQSLIDLIKSKKITLEEGLAKSDSPEMLKMNLQGIYLDESNRILDDS